MAKSVVDTTTDYISDSARKASQFTSSAADVIEDGLDTAKRAARDSCDAIEEFVHDTTRRVKRRPMESVLLALAVGIAFGFLASRVARGD